MTDAASRDISQLFHPLISKWFQERYSAPTEIQTLSWPEIMAGKHVLISAPTGSGKTLTAFLSAIDGLVSGRITVECKRLDTFIDDVGLEHVDFMKIDTEGHELKVLEDDTFFYEGVRKLKDTEIVNVDNLNFFSKFITRLSDNNPLLYGSLAILLAIILGALGAGGRQLLSKYKYIFLIKKN